MAKDGAKSFFMKGMEILAAGLILVAVIFAASYFLGKGGPRACTEEAKLCPDGSAVGRTGPNCEFAPCPSGNYPAPAEFCSQQGDTLLRIEDGPGTDGGQVILCCLGKACHEYELYQGEWTEYPVSANMDNRTRCAVDSDCACGSTADGDCFFGNKKYLSSTECSWPDFCGGMNGKLVPACQEGVCVQVMPQSACPAAPAPDCADAVPISDENGCVSYACPSDNSTIANPASVYCESLGGTSSIINEEPGPNGGGQVGMCDMPDGTVCEEWTLYRGECKGYPAYGGSANSAPAAGTIVCSTDSDCAPASSCHPNYCVNNYYVKSSTGMMCTADCEGPLDCGAGHCGCVSGKCAVIQGPSQG